MKNFLNEFKQFAMKGNVMDLAVGVIIGGAFGKIVSSLVTDIISPILGLIIGRVSFASVHIGSVMVGNFIQASIDFVIIALVIFFLIKGISLLKKKEDAAPAKAEPSAEVKLLTEIRDSLRK